MFHHDQTLHLIYLINNYSPGRWPVGDTWTEAQSGDVYPPLLSCFREHLDSEIIGHQKMISTHLFLQRLKYFQVQIPCASSEYQKPIKALHAIHCLSINISKI